LFQFFPDCPERASKARAVKYYKPGFAGTDVALSRPNSQLPWNDPVRASEEARKTLAKGASIE
jgi:hypothetical protein